MILNYQEKLYARGKPITIGSSSNSLNNCSVLAQYTNGMRTAVKTEHKSQVALDWGQSRAAIHAGVVPQNSRRSQNQTTLKRINAALQLC